MNLNCFGKIAGVVVLSLGLTACIDAKVDVEVTSQTTAKATMTQVMASEFYAMIKADQAKADADASSDDSFCVDGTLSENDDGSATCVMVEEGPFATLTLGEKESAVIFTPDGADRVRVSLPTADMKSEIGADDSMDEETRQMVEAFFSGHSVTVRFAGLEVVDTNMELSADKTSAETVIPFLDLINGTTDLPDELYAVVRTK